MTRAVRPNRRRVFGGFLCVAGFAIAAIIPNIASGVAFWDVCKYWAYEVIVIALPGVAVASWLCPRDSLLFRVTSGVAIGHALEILGFLGAASVGLKPFFALLPIAVVGAGFIQPLPSVALAQGSERGIILQP